MRKVVLASASPRRAELLKNILANVEIVPSRIDEAGIRARTPEAFAVKAAAAKAREIGKKKKNAVVIGADTVVVLGRKILGKPKDAPDAVKILKSLSGKTHRVITGLAVLDTKSGKLLTHHETTKVKMKKLPIEDIIGYVMTGSPLDKAGAYGIQEIEAMFVERIDGDFDNVVGLPAAALLKLLRALV
ncbi:MAG: septum formation protein Maf [Candidatus Saganbacteria bacterium]|nr:septum formation protein Maf [Candidatus Saganbacteria bacterium]